MDAYEVRQQHPHARLNTFESKPFAIQWSRFAEVLYLDADNVPGRDPTFLSDTPQYAQCGAISWPDNQPTTDWHEIRPLGGCSGTSRTVTNRKSSLARSPSTKLVAGGRRRLRIGAGNDPRSFSGTPSETRDCSTRF